mgnify:FL=1|tara:strand:+ start:612 stop:1055 length:444 start_codon:yes stop_codon:yes gene_type:complete
MLYLALEGLAIQQINQILKLFLLTVYLIASTSEIFAEQVTKYKNAVILISSTMTLDREVLTIPINSETQYKNLAIRVNSCFELISPRELVGNIDIERNDPDEVRIYRNFLLYNQNPNLNSDMENSYYEIRLQDCHDKEEIILNEINQ